MPKSRFHAFGIALSLLSFLLIPGALPGAEVQLNFYAAASLKKPLDAVIEKYKQVRPGVRVISNYGPSGGLYAQILQGQPCDLFFSADWLYLQKLDQEGLLLEGHKFLSDRIALVVSPSGARKISTLEDITKDGVVLSVPDPRAPAGRYTEEGLKKLGLMETIISKKNIKARPSTVNQVAIMVKEDQVDAGFLFRSVASLYDLPVVGEIASSLTGDIVFCLGIIRGGRVELARDFMEFIRDHVAEFTRYGWTPYE